MSRRQLIVTAIKTRFDAISGVTAHEWLARELAVDELPAVNIRDTVDRCEELPKDSTRQKHFLDVAVDIIVAETDATIEDTRALLALVVAAIGTDETWKVAGEECAARTTLGDARFVTDERGNWLGGARLNITVEYYTDRWSAN